MNALRSEKTDWAAAMQRARELAVFAVLMLALSACLQVLLVRLHLDWLPRLVIGTAAISALLHCALFATTIAMVLKAWRYLWNHRNRMHAHHRRPAYLLLRRITYLTLMKCGLLLAITLFPVVLFFFDNPISPLIADPTTSGLFGMMLVISILICYGMRDFRELAWMLNEDQARPALHVEVL